MALLITIILGGIIGWLASIVMHRDAQQGFVANILVGIVGAVVGSFLFSLFDNAPGTTWLVNLSFGSLISAFIGALIVSATLNEVQRGSLR